MVNFYNGVWPSELCCVYFLSEIVGPRQDHVSRSPPPVYVWQAAAQSGHEACIRKCPLAAATATEHEKLCTITIVYDQMSILEYVLSQKPDTPPPESLLVVAVRLNKLKFVQCLTASGCVMDGDFLPRIAVMHPDGAPIVRHLLSSGCPYDFVDLLNIALSMPASSAEMFATICAARPDAVISSDMIVNSTNNVIAIQFFGAGIVEPDAMLESAFASGKYNIIMFLLFDSGFEFTHINQSHMNVAIQMNSTDLVQGILNTGRVQMSIDFLSLAVRCDSDRALKIFIRYPFQVDREAENLYVDRETAEMYADQCATGGFVKCLRHLFAAGLLARCQSDSAVEWAIYKRTWKTILPVMFEYDAVRMHAPEKLYKWAAMYCGENLVCVEFLHVNGVPVTKTVRDVVARYANNAIMEFIDDKML